MSRFRQLSRAFEAYDEAPNGDSQGSIELKGPLSQAFSEALNVVYKKEVPADTSVSQESAANDELMLRNLARNLFDVNKTEAPTDTVLYGVSRSEVSPADVVNISQQYAENPDVPVVLILDGTDAGPNSPVDSEPVEKIKYLTDSLEAMVKATGGGVYTSLKDYAKHHGKHKGSTAQRKVTAPKKDFGRRMSKSVISFESIHVVDLGGVHEFKKGDDVVVHLHANDDNWKHVDTLRGKVIMMGEGRHAKIMLVKLTTGELVICSRYSEKERENHRKLTGHDLGKTEVVGIHESRAHLDSESEHKLIEQFRQTYAS